MSYGNHGWSGGIYHIRTETVAQQIYNLLNKKELERIQITGVNFFSHYEMESEERSMKKDSEIYNIHEIPL